MVQAQGPFLGVARKFEHAQGGRAFGIHADGDRMSNIRSFAVRQLLGPCVIPPRIAPYLRTFGGIFPLLFGRQFDGLARPVAQPQVKRHRFVPSHANHRAVGEGLLGIPMQWLGSRGPLSPLPPLTSPKNFLGIATSFDESPKLGHRGGPLPILFAEHEASNRDFLPSDGRQTLHIKPDTGPGVALAQLPQHIACFGPFAGRQSAFLHESA